jgi:ABC-type branched-subunit amino acid transport system substrate-binding protein
MANNWGIGEQSAALCDLGGSPGCQEVLYGIFPVPRYGDVQNAQGMQGMMATHNTYRQKDGDMMAAYQDVRYVQGYAAALMWRAAVEKAIDDGHPSPTGEDLKNALESFQDVSLQGMTAGLVSFTATDHRPQGNAAVYKINDQDTLEFVDRYSIALDASWLGY